MSASDDFVVDYGAVDAAASRVRELMSSVSTSHLPVADVSAVGHSRLAGAVLGFAERWNPVVTAAHVEADRLAGRLVDAVAEYKSTDDSVAGSAEALGSRQSDPR